jgi:hypothetical protein
VARFLLARGARPDILMATALGDAGLVTRLLDEDPVRIRTAVTPEYFPMKNPRAGGHIYNWRLDRNATPPIVAKMFGHDDVYRLLLARSPSTLRLAMACRLHDSAEVSELLAKDAGLAAKLSPGESRTLPDAASDEDMAGVELMLSAGFDVNARGQEDRTALHWAAFHGNAAMVRALLAAGADPTIVEPTHEGTALDWARYGSEHGWQPGRGDYPTVIGLLSAAAGKCGLAYRASTSSWDSSWSGATAAHGRCRHPAARRASSPTRGNSFRTCPGPVTPLEVLWRAHGRPAASSLMLQPPAQPLEGSEGRRSWLGSSPDRQARAGPLRRRARHTRPRQVSNTHDT